MRDPKWAIGISILLGAFGCAKRSTGARPVAHEAPRACLEASRRPLDGCNDCVCDAHGTWQCSQDTCASCPEPGPVASAPAAWIKNASDTICCQTPAATAMPAGWQSTTELECDERILPGFFRPPPVAGTGEATFSEIAVEFGPQALGLNASGKAVVGEAARKAAGLASEPVRVRPIVVIGETPHPVLDEELGRARASSVRQELIRDGVEAKRIKLEALERVRDRNVGMVRIGVKQPPPVAIGPEIGCVDGVSLLAALAPSDLNLARLEVCRNEACSSVRVDFGRVRSQTRAMWFALPAPLSGGGRIGEQAGGFELDVRLNGAKGTLHDGDVYRIRLRAVGRSAATLGFSSPVSYGSWVPNASKSEACLDAQISVTLAPI